MERLLPSIETCYRRRKQKRYYQHYTDDSFLLGFGTGRMSGVETVNIGATVSSVTPKIFNFTGASPDSNY